MAQVIKYQTTTVPPERSAQQLQDIVRKHGASSFTTEWDGDKVRAVRFVIHDEKMGDVPVRLVARTEGIREILFKRTSMARDKRNQQAERIAWRQLRDLTDQLMLAVQTGLWTLTDAFMASVETEDPETGEATTMGDLVRRYGETDPATGRLLLGAGPAVEIVEPIPLPASTTT